MFYLAFGYFISHLPGALPARTLDPHGNAQLIAVACVVGAVVAGVKLHAPGAALTAEQFL